MKRCTSALAVLLSLCLTVQARQDQLVCGTSPERLKEQLDLHRSNTKKVRTRFRTSTLAEKAALAARYAVGDQGDVAILTDADGVVTRQKPFNLQAKTVRFTRTGEGRYRFETVASTYDADAAARGTLIQGMQDDDSREVALPFAFAFYAGAYRSMFVNSDGNVTFGQADDTSGDRSLGRMTAAAPRLAALFDDLDPTRARDGVRVLAEAGRVVVSWVQIPEYSEYGTGAMQTFQMTLYPDSRIEFSYSAVTASDAVVGISPGGLQGSSTVVDFATTESGDYDSTVAERFSSEEQIDVFTAAQKFYLNHQDAYDYLVFYNGMGIGAGETAVAYEMTLRNNRSGYGDPPVDAGEEAGSPRRLQAIMNMGQLNQYPANLNAPVPSRGTSGDTPLTVLGHEAGHLFLAYASVPDENFEDIKPMLGRQLAHWAFTFNSEASLLEGNRIEDMGANAKPRFKTTATVQGYAPLDQYLMGFIPKESVPDTFYATNASTSAVRAPQVGVTFSGDRRNVSVDSLIQAVGRRTPDYTVSQRGFRFAFVLIVPDGAPPNTEQVAQVESLRKAFPAFYEAASGGNGHAETTLANAVHVSTFPAAGVAVGASAPVTVTLDAPAPEDLTMLVTTQGAAAAPPSVTVPTGATQATFTITGARQGVDELVVQAPAGWETVHSRVQVSAAQDMRMAVIAGDQQAAVPGHELAAPVAVRVTDVNELPYAGVSVRATVGEGSTVTPATAMTDASGVAQFRWTPGSANLNRLQLTAATGATASATTVGKPAVSSKGVVNAASFKPGIAGGSIATAFGVNLAGAAADAVQLLVNGNPTTVFYADAMQVNFFMPFAAVGSAAITVATSAGVSDAVNVQVDGVSPGIFYDTASGFGAVLTNGTGQRTDVAPVAGGGYIEIYATGLGQARADQVQVLLGATPLSVTYAGPAPGFAGLNQVNAQIPASGFAGVQTLTLVVNGVRSNTVNIRVR